jgi:hypothetical protein
MLGHKRETLNVNLQDISSRERAIQILSSFNIIMIGCLLRNVQRAVLFGRVVCKKRFKKVTMTED